MIKNISFLHVNYNNSQLTIDCIDSILLNIKKNDIEIKIIIIDNNSSNLEIKILSDWFNQNSDPFIKVLYLEQNLGYFKAFNEGFNYLSSVEKSGYVLIGNNDLKFTPDFINTLFSSYYNNDVFVIAPNIINKVGLHQNPHLIKKFALIRLFYYRIYYSYFFIAKLLMFFATLFSVRSSLNDKKDFEKSQYITLGYGACYILTKKFFQNFDKLDDYLFLMGEEGLLANQILKVGGRTFYDSKLIVYHDDHSTFNTISYYKTYNFSKESYFISKKYYKLSDINDSKIK